VDIRDEEKLVQDKESEINRLGEFLDAYNGLLSDELKEKKERREDYFNKQLVDRCTDNKKELNTYKSYTDNNLDSDEECNRKAEATKCKVNYLSDDSDDEKAKHDKNGRKN
jgi:hypothetical protein